MSVALSPVTLNPGVQQVINLKSPGTLQAIKLSNGSPFDLTVSGFGVNGQEILPAGTEQRLYADVYNSGELIVLPVNNVGLTATGVLNIVTYQVGEQLPPGNWPVTIPTQVVSAKVSTVTSLVNDGSAAGTQIIESTVSGDSASAVSLTNDAHLALGSVAHNAQIVITSSQGASTLLAQDGTVDVHNKILANLMRTETGNDMTFGVESGHNFFWQVNLVNFMQYGASGFSANVPTGQIFDFLINATDQLQFSATGFKFMQNAVQKFLTSAGGVLFDASAGTDLTLNAPNTGGGHKLNLQVGGVTGGSTDGTSFFFQVGKLARINYGVVAATAAGTSVTHGLGATPDAIFMLPAINVTVWQDTVGATTFLAHSSANANCYWVAIKGT